MPTAILSLLDRHIGAVIHRCALLIMLLLLALFALVGFLDQLDDLGRGRYHLPQALAYIALTLPQNAVELLPLVALLGGMTALSLLGANAELVALRAAGVSVWRVAVAALKSAAGFVLAAYLIGDFVAPRLDARAQHDRAAALHDDRGGAQASGGAALWLRDADTFVRIGEVLPDMSLLGVRLFEFTPPDAGGPRRLRRLVDAEAGRIEGGYWLLRGVRETSFPVGGGGLGRAAAGIDNSTAGDTNRTTTTLPTHRRPTRLTPQILSLFLIRPDQLSLGQLRRYIAHLRHNRQQTAPFELALWGKIMLPLSTAVMLILAVPFAFANPRSGNLGRNLFIGILLGLAFHAATKASAFIALTHAIPPAAAATLPVAAFALLAVVLMRRV